MLTRKQFIRNSILLSVAQIVTLPIWLPVLFVVVLIAYVVAFIGETYKSYMQTVNDKYAMQQAKVNAWLWYTLRENPQAFYSASGMKGS